ncbi:MAG TPA: sigma-70 family RNA polymerase sigma factor [Chryseosolibacter sp.]
MEELRHSLILYAYNILGSYEEAKDVVQDVYLKMTQVDQSMIRDQKLYLIRMTINLAIDQKRRQQKQRDNYPGQWLPEPIATESADSSLHRKEILSYSLMILLEKLDPKQRAVFILKEAFDYDHDEIATLLGITVDNSRKLLSRARVDLKETASPDRKVQRDLVEQYMRVLEQHDVKGLEKLLTDQITVVSDGGGKATAFMNPVHGVKSVVSLLQGLYKKSYSKAESQFGWVNHEPALFYYHDGILATIQIFQIENERIVNIFYIRNPDKMNLFKKD